MIAVLMIIAASCGTDRVVVKNLLDLPTLAAPQPDTVEELLKLSAPRWRRNASRRVAERRVVVVDVLVIAYKREADGDLHVIIRGEPGTVMIAEFVDVFCAPPERRRELAIARGAFLDAMTAHVQRLRLTGVVFFDRVHGQTGVAKNGVELHPVLKVERLP